MALPVVDTNQPEVKELISAGVKDIANMIFKSASVSITAAAKAVTPSIPEMVADITEDLRAGPINRFTQGLEKLDKLLMNFGGNIKDYSKELANFVNQREDRINKSEQTIRELRENNIKAEIGAMGEINILTQEEIRRREEAIETLKNEIKLDKEDLEIKRKMIQEIGVGADEDEVNKDFVESQNAIIEKEKEREKLLESLNKTEEDTSEEAKKTIRERASNFVDEYVPDGLRDIGSQFMEGLMAPITAVKELGFFFGGLLKPLKLLPKLFKGFIAGMLGAIASLIPFIAIGAAVVLAIVAVTMGMIKLMEVIQENKDKLIEFKDKIVAIPGQIKDFFDEKFDALGVAFNTFVEDVKAIPGKISDFFTTIFNKIQNFFIDAINGVIGMYNKLPLPDIEPLENVPMPADTTNSPVVTGEGSPTIMAAQSGTLTTENKLPFLNTNTNQNNNNNAAVAVNNTNIANNTTLGSFASSKNNDMSRMSLYSDMSP